MCPDLAAVAGDSGERLAVTISNTPATPYSPEMYRTWSVVSRGAPPVFDERAEVGIVGHEYRCGRVECVREPPPRGTSRQPRLGAIDTNPSLRRTTPTTATPTRNSEIQVGWRARTAVANWARSAVRPDRGVAARPVGPDVLQDFAAEPDQGHGERIHGDVEREDDGSVWVRRHHRRRPAGRTLRLRRSSDTRSDAASSPMRPRIALRVRPVAATSSDVSGDRTRATRGRWHSGSPPTNGLAALPEFTTSRRIVTGFVFLSLNVVTDWYTPSGGVRPPRNRPSDETSNRIAVPGRRMWSHPLGSELRGAPPMESLADKVVSVSSRSPSARSPRRPGLRRY